MPHVKRSFYTTVDHPFEIERVENVVCNFCESGSFELLGTELDYQIRECAECGLVYINPQPVAEEIPGFYDNMYLSDDDDEVRARSLGYMERQQKRLIERRKPAPGRLLDIGCGFGGVLAAMDPTPWELHGLEIGDKAVQYARRRVPRAEIRQGVIEDGGYGAGQFDCILMITVLEHLKDPMAALKRVTAWLAPGGLLIVQVPHVAPYIRLRKTVPRIPIYFEAPRHLFDFSPKTLGAYLNKVDCNEVQVDIAHPYATGGAASLAAIWAIKSVGIALHRLSANRYIFPFSGGIIGHGIKTAE